MKTNNDDFLYNNDGPGVKRSEHTPGPWLIEESSNEDEFANVFGPNDRPVAGIYIENDGSETPSEEDTANARLIAAAPEMLQALKDVSNAYQEMFAVMPVAFQTYDSIVESAIAKASGKGE
jgi:hypothetical protein